MDKNLSPKKVNLIRSHNIKNVEKFFTNKSTISPLSGSEPKWEPHVWNDTFVQENHNCYAYVLNAISSKRVGKPQPGYYGRYPYLGLDDYNCLTFYKRLKKDIPSMYLINFNDRCRKGFYKGFIALDPKDSDQDYHFYRQDNDGMWSHKPGRSKAVRTDASDNVITNPVLADRNYKYFNYSTPCFFFCLSPSLAKARSIR